MKKFLAVLLCIPLCTLMLTACNIPFFHIHTYEYICNEDSHHKVFTCGCPTPDISEEHIDHDADMRCDICGYSMWERSKWHYSDTHHWQTPEGEAVFTPVYGYGVHIDEDTNCKCDICGYLMLEPIVIEWQYNDIEASLAVSVRQR